MRHIRTSITVFVLLSLPAVLVAQDAPPEGETPPPAPPRYTGRTSASGTVGQDGATLELGNGARVIIPAGLPIGHSRTLTFSQSTDRLDGGTIVAGFVKLGPTLAFDGAIDASRTPLDVSIRNRPGSRRGFRPVLAVETRGICDATHTDVIQGMICRHWELLEAQGTPDGRLRAAVHRPGGFRLQFGWAPQPEEATPAE